MRRETNSALADFLASVETRKQVPAGTGMTVAEMAEKCGKAHCTIGALVRTAVKAGKLQHIGYRGRAPVYA